MTLNPYQSPRAEATGQTTLDEDRKGALRAVRISLLILMVPAIYNFLCFNFPASLGRAPGTIGVLERTLNTIGLVLLVSAICFFGLAALEIMTMAIHAIVARPAKLDAWKGELYLILRRAPVFAVFGALLWTIWVAAFYQLQVGFFAISIPIGIAAHLVAAGLYLPLIYRWYRIERSTARQRTT